MGSNDRKTALRLIEDGLPFDDVPHVAASDEQMRSFERAAEQMRQFKAPALWNPSDHHSYMLFGLLDGTGNDVDQDPLHPTNVARLREQIRKHNASGVDNVVFEYLPGPGTQTNFFTNSLDGGTGATALDRSEEMYWKLVRQTQGIYERDPQAKINIHLEGFSRGASTVPMVARLIHDRGIPDLKTEVQQTDENGKVTRSFGRFHQPAGQTPMSVGLYDPVPTGIQKYVDRRLPPSVVSGFQISSADELRKPFPVDRIIPEGLSADRRFLSVSVSGAHADVGGWYLRSGLADRSMNLMTDYRNALMGIPLFQRLHETDDSRLNVVHQSHTNWKFRLTGIADRDSPEGEVTRLVPDMTHATPPGQVVHVHEQAPEPANAMARRLQAHAQPVGRTPHVGPPEQTSAEGLLARLARDPTVELRPYEPRVPMSSGTRAAIGGLALNAVALAYEWNETRERAQTFRDTLGNDTAANDAYARFGAQTAGTLVGGTLGTSAAVALGAGSGGTFVLVTADAYLFGKAADNAVAMLQNQRIYSQTDCDGVAWEFNGKQWVRDDLRADLADDGRDMAQRRSFSALPEKARELSYRAGVEAVEQALGKVPEPRNPFVQPANGDDPAHLKTGDWTYSAESSRWSRSVADSVDRNDRPIWEPAPEYASPERAAQLSAQAMRVIDNNLTAGPAAVAARYQIGYHAYGYEYEGAVPASVAKALSPDQLQASDGAHYSRDAQGTWTHQGEPALPNRALELELTRDRLSPALEDHERQLTAIPPWQPPSPEQADRAMLRQLYVDNGWNPDLKPERFEASYAAVQRTRAEQGVGRENTSLALDRDAVGKFSLDSPIQHLRRDADGVVRVAATTRPDEIALVQDEARVRQPHAGTPMHAVPERSISLATPDERDVGEQPFREANRHGLPATGFAEQETRVAIDHAQAIQHEHAVATHAVSPSAPGRRNTEDRDEREPERVARAPMQPGTDKTITPESIEGHRAVTREDRDGERHPDNAPDPRKTAAHAPAKPAQPLVTQSEHPAHAMYTQALNALRTSPNIPAGTFTQHEEQKLAAGLAAQALSQQDRFPKPQVDAVVMNNDGMKLIAVYGPLESPANRLAPIDIQQSLSIASIEQSSDVSRAAMHSLQQQQQQEQAQTQAETLGVEMPTSSGPVMRIGARTPMPASGPNGDGGGDGGD